MPRYSTPDFGVGKTSGFLRVVIRNLSAPTRRHLNRGDDFADNLRHKFRPGITTSEEKYGDIDIE